MMGKISGVSCTLNFTSKVVNGKNYLSVYLVLSAVINFEGRLVVFHIFSFLVRNVFIY